MKLIGPKDVRLSFVTDGVQYTVANGTVAPEIPDHLVPETLFGLGFHQPQPEPVESPQAD